MGKAKEIRMTENLGTVRGSAVFGIAFPVTTYAKMYIIERQEMGATSCRSSVSNLCFFSSSHSSLFISNGDGFIGATCVMQLCCI